MTELKDMTSEDLEEYAAENDIDISEAKSKAQKLFTIQKIEAERKPINVTVMGVEVSVAQDVLDDLDTLDMLDELQEGNIFKLKKLLTCLFDDDWKRIHSELRDEKGRVTATKAVEFFQELLEVLNSKNS